MLSIYLIAQHGRPFERTDTGVFVGLSANRQKEWLPSAGANYFHFGMRFKRSLAAWDEGSNSSVFSIMARACPVCPVRNRAAARFVRVRSIVGLMARAWFQNSMA